MDYRDRTALCVHCDTEVQEPCAVCPSCGKNPNQSVTGSVMKWVQFLIPIALLVVLLIHY